MMAFLRRKRRHITAYIAMVLCGCITAYVFAASFETVFNKALPIVHAVNQVDVSPLQRSLDARHSVNQNDLGNYGKPLYLKVPSQDAKILLAPGIEDNGRFLARAAAAHYFVTSTPKSGDLGGLIVYFQKSWRTYSSPEKIKANDNIFIDTDRDWRYFYRVDSVTTLAASQPYVARASTTSQLIVAAANTSLQQLIIAQASLINVQNVQQ